MTTALKGDLRTLAALKRTLRKLPITASARIATRAAPEMTKLAETDYDAGQTAYGRARPLSVDGKPLDLERTGATRQALSFIAVGTTTRLTTLPRYAKYLISSYSILPNGPLPASWREMLTSIAAQVLYSEIHGAPK